jgi:hypothetical protein
MRFAAPSASFPDFDSDGPIADAEQYFSAMAHWLTRVSCTD